MPFHLVTWCSNQDMTFDIVKKKIHFGTGSGAGGGKDLTEQHLYCKFPHIRNHFFGYSLVFSNNNLLFYPLFYMKIEICFLYKGVSCV